MLRRTLQDSARPYLFTATTAILLSKFLQYLWQYIWPEIPLFYGQAPGIYVKSFFIVLAAVLWLVYQGERVRDPWLTAFLVMLAIGWLAFMPITMIHKDGTTYDMFLYLPVLLALWLKPPRAEDLTATFTFLGWLIVVVLVVTRAAEMLGAVPMVDVGIVILEFEKANYWLPLAGTLGPEGRWPGPMGHNSMTGNAAAMLVILAVTMRSKSRWVFGTVGVLTLLITASRGSQFGALVGVTAVMLLGRNPFTRNLSRKVLIGVVSAATVCGLLIVLVRNPTLTGRTTYWSIALDAWQTSPVIGVGISGFTENIELSVAGTNAHNLILDSIVKYGVAGAIFITSVLVIAAWITYRTTRIQILLPIGIFVTYLTISLTGADQGWLGVSLPWLWLVLAVMLAGRAWEQSNSSTEPGAEPFARSSGAEEDKSPPWNA